MFRAALVWGLVMAAGASEGAVRVDEDEVVFSIVAPGARRVFLVGDFNNWNPTLERMDKMGDTFQVRLFLLPGSYHYKYVVDGAWMTDADNPADDARRGSPLVLEERAGTLVLGEADAGTDSGRRAIKPSARYRGAFVLDDGKTGDDQALDFYFSLEDEKIRSLADFKTDDESWSLSPPRTEIDFDRGFVEVKLGKAKLTGFENDTIWTSHDPYRLVGQAGIYDYNAGYERKGVTLETRLPLKTDFRILYTDKIERGALAPPLIGAAELADFTASASADTTFYRFRDRFGDEDTWAMEFYTDLGSLKLGWVSRSNRGFHPGLLADASKSGGNVDLIKFNTREYWTADVVWLRWRFARHLAVVGAWGSSNAHIRKTARALATVATPADVTFGPGGSPFDEDIPLSSSTRWNGSIEYRAGNLRAATGIVYSRFEFDPFVGPGADADIFVATVEGAWTRARWRLAGVLAYTDQDYGATAPDFHYRTPTRNFWLDHRDRLYVAALTTFDLERTTGLGFGLAWNETSPATRMRIQPVTPLAMRLQVDLASSGFLGDLEYVETHLSAERGLARDFYAQLDTRLARYDKPSWNLRETFFSSYLEVGYRRHRLEASVGWGFDPVVLDGVINDYKDNGREELLRRALDAGASRDASKQLGDRVRAREKVLEDLQSLLKLEVVLLF